MDEIVKKYRHRYYLEFRFDYHKNYSSHLLQNQIYKFPPKIPTPKIPQKKFNKRGKNPTKIPQHPQNINPQIFKY